MKHFNKITIIGVGLIGGSIGLAVRKRGMAGEVAGVFRHRSTLNKALRCNAIDRGFMSIKEGVSGADLIILATPVFSIPAIAREVIKYAKKGAIITDAGSTKKWIVEEIEKLLKNKKTVSFVGSHPMAGSEHAGVEFARSGLFKGSPCIVTKTPKTDKAGLNKMIGFWKKLGGRVEVISPSAHDRRVSLISHLPHVVAFGLAGAVGEKDLAYAAEGFKDTTRVASSDPHLWSEILLSNRKEVLSAARQFELYYKKITLALSRNKRSELIKLLGKAKAKRDKFHYGPKA